MKSVFSILFAALLILSMTTGLHAQSPTEDLDQAELMKQLVGTWKAELGGDSTLTWKITPFGKGYEQQLTWKAKGKAYSTVKGISGFTMNNAQVNMYLLGEDGRAYRDLGGFVSEKKLVMNRYNDEQSMNPAMWELEILPDEKLHLLFRYRGDAETWDNAFEMKFTYSRVK